MAGWRSLTGEVHPGPKKKVLTTRSGFLSLELKQRLNTLVAHRLSLVGRKVPGESSSYNTIGLFLP